MKFVTLALALLLAIGSHAASVAVVVPSEVDHARAVVNMYIDQLKSSASQSLNHLDNTEFAKYKAQMAANLDTLYVKLKEAQTSAIPYTNSAIGQVMELTTDTRAAIMADVDALKADLETKRAHLRSVLDAHIVKYHTLLDPILTEYAAKHKTEMDSLKARLDPVMNELHQLVKTNLEETKQALVPIIETVSNKVYERLEVLKTLATPYVEEYKEQLGKAYTDAQAAAATLDVESLKAQVEPHIAGLKEKSQPLVEEVQAKLALLYAAITDAMGKN